jgi:CRISPR-associated protein Csb2
MLALSFTFPAGRYHATPWDRHVNEGAVAWPPEPWRILRALIATWHHKVKATGKHTDGTLLALIESLTAELPEYRLPVASHSHTRHYMPQFKAGDTSLIFDAFTAVKRDDPLTVTWPGVNLPDDQAALLDDLLAVMGYLGRAESWVEAKRIAEAPEANCKPDTEALDTETGELKGERVTLFASLPKDEYQVIRERFLTDKKAIKKLAATLPDSLLDALSLDTADLRKQGWNQPPAARKVSYLRPVNALRPVRVIRKACLPAATTAQFVLAGKPLPRVEDSLRVGELLRAAVMSRAKMHFGDDNVPAIFSGHGLPDDNRHGHAFYLPWDSDGDGRIDRMLLHVPVGMSLEQRRVVEKLNRIWGRDGSEWRLVLESVGEAGDGLTCKSAVWESITPYLHPWFVKKNMSIEDQIKKECRMRGLPKPIMLERLESVVIKARKRTPIHFHRFRSKRGLLTQPDTRGSFWRIEFGEPIQGPIALGFGCHFGLGLFTAQSFPIQR